MEPILAAVAACAIALLIGLVLFVVRAARRARGDIRDDVSRDVSRLVDDLNNRQNEMEVRLRADQGAIAERLHAQELKLSKTLEDGLHTATRTTLETMTKLEARLAVIDKAQANIVALSSQVVTLQDILSNKQARGAFGEIQLEDIVRQILPPAAFAFQASLSNNRRADCLLKLPNPPGPIVIDAKFPLESYRALRNAENEADKAAAARAFRTAIQTHVRHIAERYLVPGETADAALMFLPSEAIYAELHGNFPDAVDGSHRAHVFIVSPTTLWATLNTVRAVLKDVHMREQASEIQRQVHLLLDDAGRLGGRVEKLERHFGQATDDMRQIRISTDKILSRGERIKEVEMEEETAEILSTPERRVGGGSEAAE